MKERPSKKEKLALLYKKIFVENEEVGQLYLLGSRKWNDEEAMITVILSFPESKHAEYFIALILSEKFFFTNGATIEDFTGKRKMMTGTLRQLIPMQCDQIGFITDISERMGALLSKHLPSLKAMR